MEDYLINYLAFLISCPFRRKNAIESNERESRELVVPMLWNYGGVGG